MAAIEIPLSLRQTAQFTIDRGIKHFFELNSGSLQSQEDIFCSALINALESTTIRGNLVQHGKCIKMCLPDEHLVAIKIIDLSDENLHNHTTIDRQVQLLPQSLYWLKEQVKIYKSPSIYDDPYYDVYQDHLLALSNLALQHLIYEHLYPGFILPSRFVTFRNPNFNQDPIFAQIQDLIVVKECINIAKLSSYSDSTLNQLQTLADYIRLGYERYQLLPDSKIIRDKNDNIVIDHQGKIILIDSNFIFLASENIMKNYNQAMDKWKHPRSQYLPTSQVR